MLWGRLRLEERADNFVFFHRSLNTAFHSQGILRREPDQIEKALENLIELIVFHISHQQKMKLVIRINKCSS